MDSPHCADRPRRSMLLHLPEKKQRWVVANQQARKRKKEMGEVRWVGGGAGGGVGVALHASQSIRRSRVCPVHVDVSLGASVAGERQELPRARVNHTVLKTSQGTL